MSILLNSGSLTNTSINIHSGNFPNATVGVYPYNAVYTSGTYNVGVYNPSTVTIDIKRCRTCNHAHLAEQTGCIDQEGFNTIFVFCGCKEYLPKDNLEYLEYLFKKKETH